MLLIRPLQLKPLQLRLQLQAQLQQPQLPSLLLLQQRNTGMFPQAQVTD